jgi:hypothetical protein
VLTTGGSGHGCSGSRNLLIDAQRAAGSRPVVVQALPDEDARMDSGLEQVLDRELVSAAPSVDLAAPRSWNIDVGDPTGRRVQSVRVSVNGHGLLSSGK